MIAIVVLTHDRVHLLEQCVENVLARTSELTTEIVIWNNGSSDETRAYLETLTDPRIHVVHHSENIGQNAYGEAFAMTNAPFLIELDDDVIAAPTSWDRTLMDAFERLPDVGFLAAEVEEDEFDTLAHHRYRLRSHEYRLRHVKGIRIIEGPTGGYCAITSRELYETVGGFEQNARYAFFLEEPAYLAAIESLGFRGAILADLKVRHAGGEHYSKQSSAKHEFWSDYWKRERRKNQVKKWLLRLPFIARLNARHRWFTLPSAPDA